MMTIRREVQEGELIVELELVPSSLQVRKRPGRSQMDGRNITAGRIRKRDANFDTWIDAIRIGENKIEVIVLNSNLYNSTFELAINLQ